MKRLPKLTWQVLYAYQFYADLDGHGESWRNLCKERTKKAANLAWEDWLEKSEMATPWEAAVTRVNNLIEGEFNVQA
jgi:hypothetical protein